MQALAIRDLSKTYRNGVDALKGVSLEVEEGDFFALLGPNGAGKSTLIGILTSLVYKSQGSVNIFGYDIDTQFDHAKSCIGIVPQEFNFNIFEKVLSIVVDQAGYYGIPRKLAYQRAEIYLRQLGLWERRHQMIRNLSGGYKRRLMIARALLHQPKMLILDEPTAGVDVETRRSIWTFLRQLNAEGMTIILTTHYLEEAENLCRNIAIIDCGMIVENTSMAQLLRKLDFDSYIIYLSKPCSKLPEVKGYSIVMLDSLSLEVTVPQSLGISNLFKDLDNQGIIIESLRNKSNRLEELFMILTSQEYSST